jgi:hypothetical protein
MSETLEKERNFPPRYIRLPATGTLCPFTQLNRSALDQLTRPQESNNFRPPVLSRIVRQKGTSRGIRLIDYADLLRHLNSLSNESPIAGTDAAKAGPIARRLKREEATK